MNVSRIAQVTVAVVLVFLSFSFFKATAAAEEEFVAMVQRRVRDWRPTRHERLLDQVGWASNLVEAKQLAKKHGRPLFVFTYSGSTTRANAIALQRC